jgi:hypothetical protein
MTSLWRMRAACWINKATRTQAHAHAHALGHPHLRMHTQSYMQYIFFFHADNGNADAPQRNVIRTLLVLLPFDI